MDESKQWRVEFEVRHEYLAPHVPGAVTNLHQDLGERVIDIRNEPGMLAIRLHVAAPSLQEAESGATKILVPVLRHSGIGDFAITRIWTKEISSPP